MAVSMRSVWTDGETWRVPWCVKLQGLDWLQLLCCITMTILSKRARFNCVTVRTWSPRTRELYWFRRSTYIRIVQEQNKYIYLLDLWVLMFSHFVWCIFSPTVLNKIQACKIHDKWFDVFILWLISHMVTEVIILLMSSVSICHGCNSNWLLASDHIIKQRGNNALQGSLTVRMFILFNFFSSSFKGIHKGIKYLIKLSHGLVPLSWSYSRKTCV